LRNLIGLAAEQGQKYRNIRFAAHGKEWREKCIKNAETRSLRLRIENILYYVADFSKIENLTEKLRRCLSNL
jgi:hypothetical protein